MRRLSVYLFGVALGFVLLGVFSRARQAVRTPPAPVPAQAPASDSSPGGGGEGGVPAQEGP